VNRYRVYGNTPVTVVIEVYAESEQGAYEKAQEELPGLEAYAGNGGTDKLIGVSHEDACVDTADGITWDDIEVLETDVEDPDADEEAEDDDD
jgi:hypothetical protein